MNERRPLIIFTPKSLLRHPDARSPKDEFIYGKFNEIIDDDILDKSSISKIILTSGKLYYELNKFRNDNNISNVAIIRLEQYYPYPVRELKKVLLKYKNLKKLVWVQEEPKNMGALNFLKSRLPEHLSPGLEIDSVSRESSPSPAPGSYKVFTETQKKLIEEAFSK
jgi:2-oxoglutarate dehydrogenase E1 component